MSPNVEIREGYRSYQPRQWIRPSIERILAGIPQQYLGGLKTVVLTDAAGLNHARRHAKVGKRGKKFAMSAAGGLYHQAWQGQPAWIEIFVDNTLARWPRTGWRFLQDMVLSEVLLHEVGHHIHATSCPEFEDKEKVADKWKGRLSKHYFIRAYWYLWAMFAAGRLYIRVRRILNKKYMR